MKMPDMSPHDFYQVNASHAFGLLASSAEMRFERLTRLAKRLFNVPVAFVSLVEAHRPWPLQKHDDGRHAFAAASSPWKRATISSASLILISRGLAPASTSARNAIRHSPAGARVSLGGERDGKYWHLWLDDRALFRAHRCRRGLGAGPGLTPPWQATRHQA